MTTLTYFWLTLVYTSLPHDLIKAKVLSLVNWCFNRESKTFLCTSVKAGFFSNKKYDSYKCWSCAELCEAFSFLMENLYVQFDGMVYQQIVGIPMGTNCAPLIADLFLYCYEMDFMSDLQKSKRFDLIDMFNDTSRYLDDIFTIDYPEFERHISNIYPPELQLNKANTSDKETSFLDLNIKVIGSGIHTSVYDKRDDFRFPIVNFPWLSGDVPRLQSYGIYISQLVRFARYCTSVLDFHSKNLQITSKLLTQGYRYHKLRKTFGKFFRSYSELLSKFGDISLQEYLSKGISHPVFYGDLVYKLRRVKDTPNFISSGSKIVKRLRRRQYDPVIIERTIGLVLGPSTALYEPFLKHCTLTNKAVGTIWRALSKPPQRRQGPDLCPLWLLAGTPSAIRPGLAFSRAVHSRCRIEFWPHWISTRGVLIQRAVIRIQRVFSCWIATPRDRGSLHNDPSTDKIWTPNWIVTPGLLFHVELWPQVLIPRWIVTPRHDSTFNCDLGIGSQLNLERWPGS